MPDNWGYASSSPAVASPDEWAKYYEVGVRQSPINIQLDIGDLRQLACNGCGLSEQLQQVLFMSHHPKSQNNNHNNNHQAKPTSDIAVKTRRRTHLDSEGNDNNDIYDDDYDDATDLNGRSQQSSPASSDDLDISVDKQITSSSSTATTITKTRTTTDKQMSRFTDNKRQQLQQQQQQNTRYCLTNKKIFLGYPRYLSSINLSNTGHAWQIDMPPELGQHTLLAGPPLGDREYRLVQMHCHWGDNCDHGSEHQINGKGFAAELHFVHWNCKQFKSAEEASKHRHGLAVVGVLIQALDGDHNRNKHLDKIISGMASIKEPNSSTIIHDSRLDLKKLLPSNRWNYATYEGSLTTPPLSEVVDWILFLQPIQCSTQQVEQFRQLKCASGDQLVKNCRPIQAQNDRPVSIWTHSHAH